MSAAVIPGQVTWRSERDDEGHRTYYISHYVRTTTALDGPANVMQASGLPAIGDTWNFDNDIDVWAFCDPYMKVAIHQEKKGDPAKIWEVEQKFSTAPGYRCMTTAVQSPLVEPQKVSGSFVKYTKEVAFDRLGNALRNSSYEPIVGQAVEFDFNRPTIQIEQNVANLQLALVCQMMDTVNASTMWGVNPRRIKLSSFSWERKYYGVCNVYYTRHLGFDVNFETFDRNLVDEGSKALRGEFHPTTKVWTLIGSPSATNPTHYVPIKDIQTGENIRCLLDGAGKPLTAGASPVTRTLEYYSESNFFLLGIPTTF